MKKSVLISLFSAAMLAMAGCSSGSETGGSATNSAGDDGKVVVGWSQMENNNPWRIAETKSIREEAKKRGFQMVYSDAQSDTAKQVSDVEDMVAQGVDYIILAPREFEGLSPALATAKKAHIPVILVDRKVAGEAGKDYVSFLGSNFIEQGQKAADWLINEMGGKGNIVELTGTSGSSVAIDRQKGFMDKLKEKAPDMKVISSQTGDFARANGQKVMENLLQSQGDKIDAVYAHNDEMAIGAINAIKAAGKVPGKDIIIVSVDGTKDALQAIVDGKMGATVESSPFFGPSVFDVIENLEEGKEVEKEIIIKDRFFDKTNAKDFVNDAY
ncbi:sugar ABC transporter substrate-binding protein [Bacillus sp. AFS073361]|uniref:ABC transporter substrate-binding protein n=1 Tax=Bacillus sp. AFS073361 TaxID=2033511 RepID=UPI000BF366A5|nr:ABC transporter substrate-binding protein [Bacillus sp. AFS073361]PFP30618.1 sugar ABC transporter substrate-binding protein [Bacillus sp. AFS073361]